MSTAGRAAARQTVSTGERVGIAAHGAPGASHALLSAGATRGPLDAADELNRRLRTSRTEAATILN